MRLLGVSCVGIIITESLNRPRLDLQTARLYTPTAESVISAIFCDERGYEISWAGRVGQRRCCCDESVVDRHVKNRSSSGRDGCGKRC
jgi:hypothetical protein